jgi:hypothetical protein
MRASGFYDTIWLSAQQDQKIPYCTNKIYLHMPSAHA